MAQFLLQPVSHEEAVKFISGKPVVTRDVFDRLLPELRARAFTVTGIESANALAGIRDAIAKLPAGADWDDVKEDVIGRISPWLVTSDDPEKRDGEIAAAARRAELLLRTHGFQAYEAAKHESMERQKDVFEYWQYHSMEDERVRPEHAALDGLVLRSDSPFWETHYPPWDWGCRCMVTPLLPEEVDAIDAGEEAGYTLGPQATRKLEDEGMLDLGDGTPVNVTAPSETNKDDAFQWNPRDLRLPVDELKDRYDAKTWGAFETWARRQQLDDVGNTVWDWMNGMPVQQSGGLPGRLTPGARPRAILQPKTTPAPAPATKTEGTQATVEKKAPEQKKTEPKTKGGETSRPVSDALLVKVSNKATKQKVLHTLAVIDRVHKDGQLPNIPIVASRSNDYGHYQYRMTGQASNIAVHNSGPHKAMTTAHEVGHFIDHQIFGSGGLKFGSVESPEMREWKRAVEDSVAWKSINTVQYYSGARGYYLSEKELWARSYAQYIATKSADPTMLAELESIGKSPLPATQWTRDDFEPIFKAIDKLFESKGWI